MNSNLRTGLAVVGPLVMAAILVAVASMVSPQQPRPRPIQAPPPVSSLTCGFGGSSATLIAQGTGLAVRSLDQKPVSDPLAAGAIRGPVVVSGVGGHNVQAGVRSLSGEGLAWSECSAPATTGSLVVPEPRTAELVLANPDSTDAMVNITIFGAAGQLQTPGLHGLTVPARSLLRVPVAVHAPENVPVALTYEATQGRVQLQSRATSGGAEQVSADVARRSAVFAAVPADAQQVRLVLHNPNDERVEVNVDALGARGRFTPANGTASLEPHTTVSLDLTRPLRGQSVSLLVTGTDDVVGLVHTRTGADQAWIAGQSPLTDVTDMVPAGTLQVANPATAEMRVVITDADGRVTRLTLPAGAVANHEVGTGRVRVQASTPVAAALVLRGRGQAVLRLRGAAQPAAPAPGQLDPQLGR